MKGCLVGQSVSQSYVEGEELVWKGSACDCDWLAGSLVVCLFVCLFVCFFY